MVSNLVVASSVHSLLFPTISFNFRRTIFPLGSRGISWMKCIPPARRLNGATRSEIVLQVVLKANEITADQCKLRDEDRITRQLVSDHVPLFGQVHSK